MDNYGRNRQSIADIEEGLHRIFRGHPKSHTNSDGEPVIPAYALVDVLFSFSDAFNGVPLLSDEEQTMLEALLAHNPGLEVTPKILLKFIAEKTAASPSPPESPDYPNTQLPDRGRSDDRDTDRARSSSNESNQPYRRGSSRPPSRGPPHTPSSAKSPLDSERRQRSTPLVVPPSSWPKRPPAHRRKSDAGNRSDSEGVPPTSFGRSGGRVRAPSNPVSPSTSALELGSFSPLSSPTPRSRPPSRQTSLSGMYGPMHFPEDHGYSSPDETIHRRRLSFGSSGGFNTIPLPRINPNASADSGDEDGVVGRVGARDFRGSDVSMDDYARMEALARQNEDLKKKRIEYEEFLTRKIAEHEHDYSELQAALDQLRMELSATKREEKELRSKERQNMQQISALEQDVVKTNAILASTKGTYQALRESYAEQCTTSEKYRNEIREKEEKLRVLTEAYSLSEMEREKLEKERISYEDRIALLEGDLSIAQNNFTSLEEQKHENLMLKETIDRMRFDIDELRAAAVNNNMGSGQSSAASTVSKNLGLELAGKMEWDGEEDQYEAESSTETVIEEEEETEGEEEDVIQTIITRKKRKVASRAAFEAYQQRSFEEVKDYSDTGTQYDPTYFAVSRSSQTGDAPRILTASLSTQTEKEEPLIIFKPTPIIQAPTAEMEIQTEQQENDDDEPSRSPSPRHIESLASSSSTVVPCTPKALPRALLDEHDIASGGSMDQPPAYSQITHDHNWSIVADVLRKWHEGTKMPVEPVQGGISEETVEEWKTLKEELGVGCLVIDKLVESSDKTNGPRKANASNSNGKQPRRNNRFYNIYNTYVFGGDMVGSIVGQAMMVVGAGALVMLAVGPYVVPHYAIPGGATYYDRAAWNSFNTLQAAGEGFSSATSSVDGTAAVWDFLGKVGGGAARMARGWPT